MILSLQMANEQVERLLSIYPELRIGTINEGQVQLEGSILVYRAIDDYTLRKRYQIEIIIPINNDKLPYVIDVAGAINKSYRHLYCNGVLCLETDISIRSRFLDGFDLIVWMDEFVEPYFVTYEYYSEYGRFPYGERKHGLEGVLQSYQDIFETTNYTETINLLSFIKNHIYRGHHNCPCGSGEKIRNCHGSMMRKFYNHDILMRQIAIDVSNLEAELREYHARSNTETSK